MPVGMVGYTVAVHFVKMLQDIKKREVLSHLPAPLALTTFFLFCYDAKINIIKLVAMAL